MRRRTETGFHSVRQGEQKYRRAAQFLFGGRQSALGQLISLKVESWYMGNVS